MEPQRYLADVLARVFNDFDARDCQCFDAKDKDKLLTIIKTAFGSFDAFNATVRDLLVRAGLQRKRMRHSIVKMEERRASLGGAMMERDTATGLPMGMPEINVTA